MIKIAALLATATAAALAAAMLATTPGHAVPGPSPHAVPGTRPVVIELFQSQGCSSCPPALAVLDQEANRPDVIALNFAVTYWDQLGWKDIYARPEYTARQWDYARASGRGNVATPQLIVAGRQAVLGSRKGEVDAAIAAAARQDGPTIALTNGRISIGAGKTATPATVWIAEYDPRTVAVPIRAGENGGRILPHRNIVKLLATLGNWNGAARRYVLPAPHPGWSRAVLVQAGKGGPILAAARI